MPINIINRLKDINYAVKNYISCILGHLYIIYIKNI